MSSNAYGMFSESVLYTSNGIRRTRSLFKETSVFGDSPVFTLRKNKAFINIKELYVTYCTEDPSEATFAETVFGDVSFWNNIAKCDWIQEDLREWRETAEVRRKAMAFKAVMEEVKGGGRSSFSAAKFLIEEPWKNKRDKRVKEDSAKTTTKAKDIVSDDLSRLREEGYFQ